MMWSPALPKPSAAVSRIRESLISTSKRSSFSGFVRKDFTAPTPNDRFASFPTFTAAMDVGSVIMPFQGCFGMRGFKHSSWYLP